MEGGGTPLALHLRMTVSPILAVSKLSWCRARMEGATNTVSRWLCSLTPSMVVIWQAYSPASSFLRLEMLRMLFPLSTSTTNLVSKVSSVGPVERTVKPRRHKIIEGGLGSEKIRLSL